VDPGAPAPPTAAKLPLEPGEMVFTEVGETGEAVPVEPDEVEVWVTVTGALRSIGATLTVVVAVVVCVDSTVTGGRLV
jgi:hypothetical protein